MLLSKEINNGSSSEADNTAYYRLCVDVLCVDGVGKYDRLRSEVDMSEFGTGCVYNLGLFLAHAERYRHDKEIYDRAKLDGFSNAESMAAEMWFNGASDHLYDLTWPIEWDGVLKHRLEEFKDKCLDLGHGCGFGSKSVTELDVNWAIQEAKDLLFEIDRQILGIAVERGDWE